MFKKMVALSLFMISLVSTGAQANPLAPSSKRVGIVLLAAGLGSRMKSDIPKVLHKIHGHPMLYYTLNQIRNAAPDAAVALVVGYKKEMVEAYVRGEDSFKEMDISFIEQPEQLGTGHAARCAMDSPWGEDRVNENSAILIIPGDLPLLSAGLFSEMTTPLNEGVIMKLLTTILDNPKGYGRIIRNENGSVLRITEEKDANAEQKEIREVGCSTYLFQPEFLKNGLHGLSTNNAQKEYYLTDLVANAALANLKIDVLVWGDPSDLRGVNDPAELAEAAEIMSVRLKK